MVNCAHALIYIVLARDPPPSDEGQVECDFEAAAGRELEKLYEAAKLGSERRQSHRSRLCGTDG